MHKKVEAEQVHNPSCFFEVLPTYAIDVSDIPGDYAQKLTSKPIARKT